jgi:hypothetical protein
MRFRSLFSTSIALPVLVFLAACGGGDGGEGTGPTTPVPTTVTITSPAIALTEIGQTATVTATVLDQDGAPIASPTLGFASSDNSVAVVSPAGVVTATGDGSATITVSSGSASAATTATVTISVLTLGEPLTGLSAASGSERLLTVDVAQADLGGKVLEFATRGGSGNATLIVRRGQPPVPPSTFDCIGLQDGTSFLPGNIEFCAFGAPEAGTWNVILVGPYNGLELEARLVDVTTVQSGAPITGLSAGEDEFRYFDFEVPGAATATEPSQLIASSSAVSVFDPEAKDRPSKVGAARVPEASGTDGVASLTITAQGGSGDADLLGDFAPSLSFTTVDPVPCVSFATGNAESCTVTEPTPGRWTFTLYAFEAYAGVEFALDFHPGGPPPDPGTITIQKSVTAFDGGTANNPANPSLAGFDFEIRSAGGSTVVATATTNASGTAVATVAPGSYDIVESDAQGLTDVTSAANGVVVTEGANTGVAWENRQIDPSAGTITIQKTVTSSAGGTADNPANPSLSGFEFEVRPAGGGTVVATITTDATGTGVATLSPGSYDIVESNAQGLTDFTAAVNAVPVPVSGNVNVPWENRQDDPAANQEPVVSVFAGPVSVPTADGNGTIVYLNAGNSTDPDGDPLSYTWTSPTATFLGGTTGAFTRATFPSAPATVTVTVDDGRGGVVARQVNVPSAPPLPAPGTYNIELVNVVPPPPSVQSALNQAVTTWERVIRNELSNISFTPPVAAGTCFDSQPEIEGTVDDIRIYVDIDSIDGPGSVLGRAGPCFSRNSDGTIIVGFMQFDSQDLENLSPTVLNAVILHEMAHVFGIGTLWPSRGFLENPSCAGPPPEPCTSASPSPDTRYTGPDGAQAWLALGGLLTDGGAPVENGEGNSAGAGTRDGHWREIVFDTELMTGFVEPTSNPLSILTLAALEDVGLSLIDYSQADNYVVPTLAPSPAVAAARLGGGGESGGVSLHGDAYLGPVWVVDEEGTIVGVIPPAR